MKCPIESRQNQELLLDYCAGRLDKAASAAVARHVAGCPACGEVCAGQRSVWQALEEWETAPVSPEFNRRLYHRIEQEAAASWWARVLRTLGPGLVRRGIPAAAAAGLLLMAGSLLETRPPAGDAAQARFEVQADQVERTLEDLELLETLSRDLRQPSASSL